MTAVLSEAMNVRTINVAREFSRTPGGRYRADSDYSGERFREDFLVEALRHHPQYDRIVVEMDGVLGYPSSFLEEAFGGLIRKEGFTLSEVQNRIVLHADAARFSINVAQAKQYMGDARPER